MITLTLLHPIQSVPVQSWPFDTESVIRIGRSTDNDVVLYSAVVSRHHVEIRRNNLDWEVVSLGANGTYINGKPIDKSRVVDGVIIRLASSGPKIQIRISNDIGGQPKGEKEKRRKPQEREQTRDTFINS